MQSRPRPLIESGLEITARIWGGAATNGVGEWLGDINTQRHDRKAESNADTNRVLNGISERVERVTHVDEGGDTKISGEISNDLERTRREVSGTHFRTAVFDRGQIVESEAANATITAGEKTLRAG